MCLAGTKDDIEERRVHDIVQGLRSKDDAGVEFTQGAQPVLNLACKEWILEEHPALIQDNQGRPILRDVMAVIAFEQVLDAMEDEHECRPYDAFLVDDFTHLERLPGRQLECIFIRIEDIAVLTGIAILVILGERIERCLQLFILQVINEVRDGAEGQRRIRQYTERIADQALDARRNLDVLFTQEVTKPFLRLLPLMDVVDLRQGLERKGILSFLT